MTGKYTSHLVRAIALTACFTADRPIWAQKTQPQSSATADSLRAGFIDPPQSARPRVWWHWMNGNISKEGIKLDLEWMHQAGLGGFQTFDAALATPKVVPQRLVFMTPEWKDAFKYATMLADQYGFEAAIAGSPGWSESGGPWVSPAEAMKKYVWSETSVEGGKPYTGKLNHPPTTTGAYQSLPHDASKPTEPKYYADSAVIAFPAPAGYRTVPLQRAKITVSSGKVDAKRLEGDDLATPAAVITVESGAQQKPWIQYEFNQPQTIRSMTLVRVPGAERDLYFTGVGQPAPPAVGAMLEASDDGVTFHSVLEMKKVVLIGRSESHTLSFAPVTARFFRLLLTPGKPNPKGEVAPVGIAQFTLRADPRVDHLEEKAAFVPFPDLYPYPTPEVSPADAIRKSTVIDLTGKMRPDGSLDWTPPAGQWVVLRIGYSLLGTTNHPATAEATGLEVDKLNAGYVKHYIDHYLDLYQTAVGPGLMGRRGLGFVVNDSWEAGAQNWTDNLLADFARLRGYNPQPWLPVLAGLVVESASASDQFLWDLRKTISDLTATNHYGQLDRSIHARAMGHYTESHESGRHIIADGMEVKKGADVPMGAMWTAIPGREGTSFNYDADDRESASVAHLYGQNLVAAESLTAALGPWSWSPATLKPTADHEFANGINRFAIHESAHQPLINMAPGLTLGPFGQWFNRNETWADEARSWVDYLSRSSYMLQQGRFAADLLYFYGEGSNITSIFVNKAPNVPKGYQFDYVNPDALMHLLQVRDGRISTPSGMSYRVLALDPYSIHMSLPVLRALHRLVEQGAIVAGMKPVDDPSLADDKAEFDRLRQELFGDGSGVRTVGKGKVYAGQDAASALSASEIAPDFEVDPGKKGTPFEFVHRIVPDGDLYFVASRSDHAVSAEVSFRVTGKEPELWHAETGQSEPVSYATAHGRTTIPLQMDPWGAVFVIFRRPTQQAARTLPPMVETPLTTLQGPWDVSFQKGRGAPESITLESLSSWSNNPQAGVKYYSGAGTYTKTIDASADWFKPGATVWLDLGDVKNLADVQVNGHPVGVAWHAPFRVDVTSTLEPGQNVITIKVVNAWVNRLIGDQQPGATKYTFADVVPYQANSPLLPSGLLGPVTLLRKEPK